MIDFKWQDVDKKPEEEDLKKEKQEKQQEAEQQEQQEKQQEQQQAESNDEAEPLGISDLIVETWNDIAVERGYEPVFDKQQAQLRKHFARLDAKYTKNIDILPELEAALASAIIFVPKYLKHRKIAKTADNKK